MSSEATRRASDFYALCGLRENGELGRDILKQFQAVCEGVFWDQENEKALSGLLVTTIDTKSRYFWRRSGPERMKGGDWVDHLLNLECKRTTGHHYIKCHRT
jgi:hypothetical protein